MKTIIRDLEIRVGKVRNAVKLRVCVQSIAYVSSTRESMVFLCNTWIKAVTVVRHQPQAHSVSLHHKMGSCQEIHGTFASRNYPTFFQFLHQFGSGLFHTSGWATGIRAKHASHICCNIFIHFYVHFLVHVFPS